MKIVGTKLTLRILGKDSPEEVADTVRDWVDRELSCRQPEERDTELVIVIGMDIK